MVMVIILLQVRKGKKVVIKNYFLIYIDFYTSYDVDWYLYDSRSNKLKLRFHGNVCA